MRTLSLILAITLLPLTTSAQLQGGDEHVLSVSGTGTVLFEPDFGTLRMNVSGDARTVAEAKAMTDQIAGTFVEKAEDLGVEARDIRSDPMTARPAQDRDGRTFISFSRETTLLLRDLTVFEDIEAAAIESGITNIGEIEYGHSELERLQDEALQQAFDDARDQAEQAVAALDLTLGRVLSVSVDPRPRMGMPQPMFRVAEMAANIRTGVQEVSRTVQISYRLLE
jgi:hypothetical protein